MRRREFITLLGGAAAAWPLAARAQQPERMRRIGVLLPAAADDARISGRASAAFLQALALLGWTIGRNVRIDTRWATANAADIRRHAAELVALAPDVILATGSLDRGSVAAGDPNRADRALGAPLIRWAPVSVDSLARPGGNATGFMLFEYSIAGKWLALLKQIVPSVTRAAFLREPSQEGGTSQFAAVQAVAPSLGVEITPVNVRGDAGEIERAVVAFARTPNGGLIVTGGPTCGASP